MKTKKSLIIFCLLLIILGLVAITNRRFRGLNEKLSSELLELNFDEIEEAYSAKEAPLQRFSSQYGKLTIDYPLDWAAMEQQEIIGAMAPETWREKYGLRTLLFAMQINNGSSQLVAYKGNFGGLGVRGIIEEIKGASQNQGWKMNVVSSEVEEKKAVFEAKYETSDGLLFHSKEKILINGNEAYLITALSLEEDWQEARDNIDKIVDSAIVLD